MADIPASSQQAPGVADSLPEDQGEDPLQPDQDLFSPLESIVEDVLPLFSVKPTQQGEHVNLLAKPAKAKNAEFDMKGSASENQTRLNGRPSSL